MSSQEFTLSQIQANGITFRLATFPNNPPYPQQQHHHKQKQKQPLVMLLHGWPESWYSWRHQLRAFAQHNYHVVAPDMRGYGGTSSPTSLSSYSIEILVKDITEIAKSLGYSKIIVIGHDMGAYLAWFVALFCPEMVVGVCGLSVPYLGHTPQVPHMVRLQRKKGFCLPQPPYCATREEQEKSLFHYMVFHNLERSEEGYDKNVRETLYRVYGFSPGVECEEGTPEVTDKRMFPPDFIDKNNDALLDGRSAVGWWARFPRPKTLPDWLCEGDLDYFVHQFENSGFVGGLYWYRAFDMNWIRTLGLKGKKVSPPSLFLCGKNDISVLNNHGGAERVIAGIRENCSDLRGVTMIDDAGHWVQQEKPNEVNQLLLHFVSSLLTSGTKEQSKL